jgi:peptidoglycan/xylan/chitin deacetylase (PgdA/CDA1 family)
MLDDDGPGNYSYTVLNSLAAHGAKSTFFVMGSNVLENPQILMDIYNAGHTIGIHTWSHPFLTSLTNDEIVAEIFWTAKLIHDIL